jgi:hypothetical protein
VKNSAIFLASLAQLTMATSLAIGNPKQYDNVMSLPPVVRVPFTKPPAPDSTTRMFVRRECFEPAEGSAHFYDLTALLSSLHMRGELLSGEDCGPAGEDDADD